MTEDQIKIEGHSQITKPAREPLTKAGVNKAKESIKKAQETGSWPKTEIPQSLATDSNSIDEKYPIGKEYPDPKAREKMLESYPNQEKTIPPEIKEKLTKEAEELNIMTMETGGEKTEKETELPQAKTFTEKRVASSSPAKAPETVKAQGGAEPLRRIMKAQEEMEKEKVSLRESAPERMKARIEKKQVEVPSEAKKYVPPSQVPLEKSVPQPIIEPAPQEATQPLKSERKPFFSRTFRKIFGKK